LRSLQVTVSLIAKESKIDLDKKLSKHRSRLETCLVILCVDSNGQVATSNLL